MSMLLTPNQLNNAFAFPSYPVWILSPGLFLEPMLTRLQMSTLMNAAMLHTSDWVQQESPCALPTSVMGLGAALAAYVWLENTYFAQRGGVFAVTIFDAAMGHALKIFQQSHLTNWPTCKAPPGLSQIDHLEKRNHQQLSLWINGQIWNSCKSWHLNPDGKTETMWLALPCNWNWINVIVVAIWTILAIMLAAPHCMMAKSGSFGGTHISGKWQNTIKRGNSKSCQWTSIVALVQKEFPAKLTNTTETGFSRDFFLATTLCQQGKE